VERPEPDAALSQAGDDVDQMTQGAAEAVEFPDDQGVAGPQLVEDLLEGGSVGAGAAGGLGEHPVAAGRREGVDLELGVLVGGGDAGIAEQMTHAADRLTTVRQRWLCDVDFGHEFWTRPGPIGRRLRGNRRNVRFCDRLGRPAPTRS
jgi:hypothetical protein